MDDEYHLLFACSAYKAIHEDYDELIHMHDNKDGHICVHYFQNESFNTKLWPSLQEGSAIPDDMFIWPHILQLAFLQTILQIME